MRPLLILLATGLGTGFSPLAPGTLGSLLTLGIILVWAPSPSWLHLGLLLLVTWGSVYVVRWAEGHFGKVDDRRINLDEVVGMGWAVVLLPARPGYAVAAFLVFRILDAWKPMPLARLEGWPRGWGIMADDLGAGLAANLLVRTGAYFLGGGP